MTKTVLMHLIPVESHYFWRVNDGEKKEGVKFFDFEGINVMKIKRSAVVSQFSKKKWIKKVKIIEAEGDKKYVIWSYKNMPDVFIYKDGFYCMRNVNTYNKKPNDKEIQAVYRCASVINDCGYIMDFRLVI